MEDWPSSALRMRTTNHVLESSVDWSLYINIKKKKLVRLSVRYQNREHDSLKTNEPIVMQIGTSGQRIART